MSTIDCQICGKQKFKYTCPKCNLVYCSLECYKGKLHQKCSEEFYKSCVEDELKLRTNGSTPGHLSNFSNDVKKMHEILTREATKDEDGEDYEGLQVADSDDEEDCEDMAKRLEGVDLNNSEEVWQKLTSQEKQDFDQLVQNGKILDLLPPFRPWWEMQPKTKLIEDLSEDPAKKPRNLPRILDNIPSLETMTTRSLSQCLVFNLHNILAAYVSTVRFFAGEHSTTPLEAANYLIALSANLKKNANFDDTEQALKSILIESQAEHLEIAVDDCVIIRKDLETIINGKYYLPALSDIHRLLKTTKAKISKELKSEDRREKLSNLKMNNYTSKSQLGQLVKKIEFFLAFAKSKS